MTFEEVMKQVQTRGNENQEKLKSAINTIEDCYGLALTVYIDDNNKSEIEYTTIFITAEQFLAIYKILGE